jgi:arsenite/tail-anchored protein-transporting ATPase
MNMDETAFDALQKDKLRYERAMQVLKDKSTTAFTLILLPERLPIEETQSAIDGLGKLEISVQALVVNQSILPEVVKGNRFLAARAEIQSRYQTEIDTRFAQLIQSTVPLFDRDTSSLPSLRQVGEILYGN